MLHGECVSLGMTAASYLSYQRNLIGKEDFQTIISCLRAYDLPVDLKDSGGEINTEELYAITTNDKKMSSGQIRFVLLNSLGSAYTDSTVTKNDIIASLDYLLGRK